MKDKIGYQVGLASQLPVNEAGFVNLIASSINWQDNNGPCVIFVDEPFYRFLVRTNIEMIYHDIIPLPEDADIESALSYIQGVFPVEIFPVENIHKGRMERHEINEYMSMIPDQIKDNWNEMLMNEEMILSLSQVNSN